MGMTVTLKPSELFPEIRFERTYGSLFSGTKETERHLNLSNIIKGYAKDFIFEITLNGVSDTEKLEETGALVKMIETTLKLENLSGKAFEVKDSFDMQVYNQSSNVTIVEEIDVKKNILRVRASEVIESVDNYCDVGEYAKGMTCLDEMCEQLEEFENDEVMMEIGNVMKAQ